MADLHNQDYQIKLKQGTQSNINATGTHNAAIQGELHYTTDSQVTYIFNGTKNIQQGMRFTTGSVAPTTGNLPNPGEFGIHMASGTVWFAYNLSGTVLKVQLT